MEQAIAAMAIFSSPWLPENQIETERAVALCWHPSLEEFRNFLLGNDINHIIQEYSLIAVYS